MKLYHQLSGIGFLRNNYAYKFLFVAFIGIHIPLIGMILYLVFTKEIISETSVLLFTLIMTLFATGVTLYVLKKLIRPVEIASEALIAYRKNRVIPQLPKNYGDQAGVLMENIQDTIETNSNLIREKLDLMYLLSHDLKNFAANPHSLAKLILEKETDEQVREYAELIVKSTEQQFRFIENFTRMITVEDEISKQTPEKHRIPLSAIFAQVKELTQSQLSRKNILLVTKENVSEFNTTISQELLVRVLVNLVDNAIKFSFEDSEIWLEAEQDKTQFCITVSDKGIGFDEKQGKMLFDKFTALTRMGTKNEPSTGIGLYLCRKIVEKYHGTLTAESSGLNSGAVFTIGFDLAAVH